MKNISSDDFEDLFKLWKEGKSDPAGDVLYKKCCRYLMAIGIKRWSGIPLDDLEIIVSESVSDTLMKYDGRGNLKILLAIVFRNKRTNWFREKAKGEGILAEIKKGRDNREAVSKDDPECHMNEMDLRKLIEKTIERYPKAQKLYIKLSILEGFIDEEVQEILEKDYDIKRSFADLKLHAIQRLMRDLEGLL